MVFWRKDDSDDQGKPRSSPPASGNLSLTGSGQAPNAAVSASGNSATGSKMASFTDRARQSSAQTNSIGDAVEQVTSLEKRYGKLRPSFTPGTVVQGKLTFDSPVRVDGELEGEISSTKPFIVGPKGKINATVNVPVLVVLGEVTGQVTATERIEILDHGVLTADVSTPSLVIEAGAEFNGRCVMTRTNS